MMTFFFFNDTATTEIYTLSLHDALPISSHQAHQQQTGAQGAAQQTANQSQTSQQQAPKVPTEEERDRKSTRLNSSHANISYAVFCLKKKNNISQPPVISTFSLHLF